MESTAKKKKKKNTARLKVWKLKEESTKQEFAQVTADSINEVLEDENVEDKWNTAKAEWLKAAEQVCGWTKVPPSHNRMW